MFFFLYPVWYLKKIKGDSCGYIFLLFWNIILILHDFSVIKPFIIVPAKVQNLVCRGNSADMSLTVTWGELVARGSGVIGYSVECQRVHQSPSRELVTMPLSPAYDEEVEETRALVTQGLGTYVKH